MNQNSDTIFKRYNNTVSENNSLKQSMETRVLFERYNNTVSDLGGGGGGYLGPILLGRCRWPNFKNMQRIRTY